MKRFTVSVPDELYERIVKAAQARRWSINTLINWLIEQFLVQAEQQSNGGK